MRKIEKKTFVCIELYRIVLETQCPKETVRVTVTLFLEKDDFTK